ncbi:TPA: RHS repeat-associated core domain-containing protein, partial [Vibrio vulnificus]
KGSRSFFRSATLTEDLHVLVIGQSGAGTARMLHWAQGKPAALENDVLRYSVDSHLGSSALEFNQEADILTQEEYYPYGGTAVWSAKNQTEAKYRTVRYSGKERDATGLYYYGYRYYQPWAGRWLNPDPAGTVDGLNLFRMVRNNPTTLHDGDGRAPLRRYPGTQTTFGGMGGVKFEKQSYLATKNSSGLYELSEKGAGAHPIGLEGDITQIYHQLTATHRDETIINTVDSFVNTSINGTAPPSRAIYARLEELSEYQNGATYLNPVGNSVKALFSGAVNLGIRTGLPTPEPILGTTPGTVGKASVGLIKSVARVAESVRDGAAKGEASGNAANELRSIRLIISNEKQDGMLYIGNGQVTLEQVANRLFSSKGSTELSLIGRMSQQASQNPTYRKRAQREIASKLMDAVTIHH